MKIMPLNLGLGFLSIVSCLAITSVMTESASAQCVQAHTGVQLNIGRSPARQTHNTQFKNQGSCTGNASSSTSTQVNIGGKNPRQHQEVRHETRRGRPNPSGVNGPTIGIGVVTPINVRTPKNFPY